MAKEVIGPTGDAAAIVLSGERDVPSNLPSKCCHCCHCCHFGPEVKPFVMGGILHRLITYSSAKWWMWHSSPMLSNRWRKVIRPLYHLLQDLGSLVEGGQKEQKAPSGGGGSFQRSKKLGKLTRLRKANET